MLKRLVISNLAIIENIDVKFKNGFTVLTGGTGAGKSLVIDSLDLLLGARAASELIRAGEDKASITGYFECHNPRLDAAMSNLNIDCIDGEIIIERTISKTKNAIKVNGTVVTLQELNKIAKHLADIHSQLDFVKILNPDNYLEIVDGFSFDSISAYKRDYSSLLDEYRAKRRIYEDLLDKKRKLDENRDYLEYQYNELKAAGLVKGEEEQIESELSLLKNYDKVYSLIREANSIMDDGFLDKFADFNNVLGKLSAIQSQYKETYDSLDEDYYRIEDTLRALRKSFKGIDYDPDRLDELQQRQSDLSTLKRKYRKSIEELIEYKNELAKMIGKDSTFDDDIVDAKNERDEAYRNLFNKGAELTQIRKRVAKSIEKEVEKNLKDLLLNVKFEIVFQPYEDNQETIVFGESGLDQIDFLIETNIGEGLKPLSKIVSGGEASRIMLAFKAIFIKANKISTVIFDEIDTGISGEASQAVANKIKEISLSSQVVAITHMPQVASLSDNHILIAKEVVNGRTFARVKELDLEGKIHEVAHLISGGKVTEKQLDYAREMVMSKTL